MKSARKVMDRWNYSFFLLIQRILMSILSLSLLKKLLHFFHKDLQKFIQSTVFFNLQEVIYQGKRNY
uniref:Uncharacterized protein n=1 Tax=Arundo donax TaxID=35708 RepID=A0A0A9FZY3_ARUDO